MTSYNEQIIKQCKQCEDAAIQGHVMRSDIIHALCQSAMIRTSFEDDFHYTMSDRNSLDIFHQYQKVLKDDQSTSPSTLFINKAIDVKHIMAYPRMVKLSSRQAVSFYYIDGRACMLPDTEYSMSIKHAFAFVDHYDKVFHQSNCLDDIHDTKMSLYGKNFDNLYTHDKYLAIQYNYAAPLFKQKGHTANYAIEKFTQSLLDNQPYGYYIVSNSRKRQEMYENDGRGLITICRVVLFFEANSATRNMMDNINDLFFDTRMYAEMRSRDKKIYDLKCQIDSLQHDNEVDASFCDTMHKRKDVDNG